MRRTPTLRRLASPLALAAVLALSGCAVAPPAGPMVLVMPGPGKSLAAFDADDARCRQAASQAVSRQPAIAGPDARRSGGLLGASGDAGAASMQRQYDLTYSQCTVAAGNTLPGYASGGSYAYPLYGYPYPPPYAGYPLF
jgi:hypothetical protein